MSDVGDAIELTYTTAPGAVVHLTWRNTGTDIVLHDNIAVAEEASTGRYPVTLVGTLPGTWEAVFASTGTSTAVEVYYERFDLPGGVPPLATLGEYTELYGSLSTARSATCRALLRRASQLIRDSYPGIDLKITSGTAAADTVGLAVINMTARVLRNPGGLRSETTGPFSRSYDPDAASGMLELTEAERELLAEAGVGVSTSTRRKRGAGTARITGGLVPPSRPGRRWPRGPWT